MLISIKMLIIKGITPATSNLQSDSRFQKNYIAHKFPMALCSLGIEHWCVDQADFTEVKILVSETECEWAQKKGTSVHENLLLLKDILKSSLL